VCLVLARGRCCRHPVSSSSLVIPILPPSRCSHTSIFLQLILRQCRDFTFPYAAAVSHTFVLNWRRARAVSPLTLVFSTLRSSSSIGVRCSFLACRMQ
jgi:hypothetical protein